MAEKHNLSIDQGETWTQSLRWLDASSNPFDLSAYTARMDVREAFDSTTELIELTTSNGRITLDDDGNIELLISAADSAELEAGTYLYDLELVSPGGVVKRLVEGKVKVRAEVTR